MKEGALEMPRILRSLSVNISSMPNFDDCYNENCVLDGVEDSIHATPKAIFFLTGQLYGLRGTRIIG